MATAAPLPPPATFTAEMVPEADPKGKSKASSSSSGAKVPKWLKTGIGNSESHVATRSAGR